MGRGWRSRFGLLSMTPATSMLAFGTSRAGGLQRWGVWALWTITPLLVLLLVYGGFADGPAETVGVSLLLGVFAVSWVMIGLSVRPGSSAVIREAGG